MVDVIGRLTLDGRNGLRPTASSLACCDDLEMFDGAGLDDVTVRTDESVDNEAGRLRLVIFLVILTWSK